MASVVFTLFLTSVCLVSIYLFKKYKKWKKNWDLVNKMPGPHSYPIIGSAWDLMRIPRSELFAVFEKRIAAHRPLFRTWMGPIPEIHIMRADDMEFILSSTTIIDKGFLYEFLAPWLGTGLITGTGAKWHKHRKLITPTFHFSILENFIDVFEEKSKELVEKLKPLSNGDVFDICPQVTLCALDIICRTAMGVDVNAMSKANSDYVSAIHVMCEVITQRSFKPWYIIDAIFYRSEYGKRFKTSLDQLHRFTNKIIKERIETRKNRNENQISEDEIIGKKKRMAFLDLLLEAKDKGAELSDTDIREEVDTFMFAGHDTTTTAICWTLFMLGNHPDVQEKVAEELKQINTNESESLTMQDLAQMKYLERVIKETLRLYPSVPFILRQTKETIHIGGYEIPPYCIIALHIRDIHRDPEYFPNPDHFDPDNFLPERCQTRHPFAYVPFSAGPRNCIGQKFAMLEMKTVISAIVRKYKIQSVDKPEDITYFPELLLRSQTGLKLTLSAR